jgi:hypothetical protein
LLADPDRFGAEQVPEGSFPNTTFVLMPYRSKSAHVRAQEEKPTEIVDAIVRGVGPYLAELEELGLVVFTAEALEGDVRGQVAAAQAARLLPPKVEVAHFGALRGRNDFRRYGAVCLTHPHRYDEEFFLGLGLLLSGFQGDRVFKEWTNKNSWSRYDGLVGRAVAAEAYQDILRIRLRDKPDARAIVFFPSQRAQEVVRLMRLFPGARFETSDGAVVREGGAAA